MSWNALSQEIHEINVSKGFWPADKTTRNFGEAIALIHAELHEADVAGLLDDPDDKLPQYPGVFVELSDAMIRLMDLGGFLEVDFDAVMDADDGEIARVDNWTSLREDLIEVHGALSEALELHRKKDAGFRLFLGSAFALLLSMSEKYGFDAMEIIEAKVAFNRTRPHMHGRSY